MRNFHHLGVALIDDGCTINGEHDVAHLQARRLGGGVGFNGGHHDGLRTVNTKTKLAGLPEHDDRFVGGCG